jgi:DNA-binding NarL/FixJ family response regulator
MLYSLEQQDRIRHWHEQTARRLAALSARELEVFQLLAAGHTNAEIAEHLEVSIKTIESHVTKVLHKLGVATRREAIAWAKQTDVFEP